MNTNDEPVSGSADGIRQCLRLLAEEAAALKLSGTFSAIEAALAMIAVECAEERRQPVARWRSGMSVH